MAKKKCSSSIKDAIESTKGTPYSVEYRSSKNGKPQYIQLNDTLNNFQDVIESDCESASKHGRFSESGGQDGSDSEVCEQALAEEAPCIQIGALNSTKILKSRLAKKYKQNNFQSELDDYEEHQARDFDVTKKIESIKNVIKKLLKNLQSNDFQLIEKIKKFNPSEKIYSLPDNLFTTYSFIGKQLGVFTTKEDAIFESYQNFLSYIETIKSITKDKKEKKFSTVKNLLVNDDDYANKIFSIPENKISITEDEFHALPLPKVGDIVVSVEGQIGKLISIDTKYNRAEYYYEDKNGTHTYIDSIYNVRKYKPKIKKSLVKPVRKKMPTKKTQTDSMPSDIFYITKDNFVSLNLKKTYWVKLKDSVKDLIKKNFRWNPYEKNWKSKTKNALAVLKNLEIPEQKNQSTPKPKAEKVKKTIPKAEKKYKPTNNFLVPTIVKTRNISVEERLDNIEKGQKAIANVILYIKPKIEKIEQDLEIVKQISEGTKTYSYDDVEEIF